MSAALEKSQDWKSEVTKVLILLSLLQNDEEHQDTSDPSSAESAAPESFVWI